MEEKLMELKQDVIVDTFSLEGMEIAVLNNNYFGTENAEKVYLGKVVEENNENVLLPLTDSEYELAYAKYEELVNLFEERGE